MLIGSDSITGRSHLRVDEETLLGLEVQPVEEPTVKPVGPNLRSVERVKCPTSQHRSLPDDWIGARDVNLSVFFDSCLSSEHDRQSSGNHSLSADPHSIISEWKR
jgi:hypothetical protein